MLATFTPPSLEGTLQRPSQGGGASWGGAAFDPDAPLPARIEHARKLAAESRAIALIKGSRTVIAEPEGGVVVNLTGSSVLATAGSGDVLTGVIGGLLARGVRAQAAAWAAAYVHGVAGTGRTVDQKPAAITNARSIGRLRLLQAWVRKRWRADDDVGPMHFLRLENRPDGRRCEAGRRLET